MQISFSVSLTNLKYDDFHQQLFDLFAGKEDEVKQWCPIPMLGAFTYSHNDGSTVTCAANSLLNVCDAWTTMTFDYAKCSTVQGFSSMF